MILGIIFYDILIHKINLIYDIKAKERAYNNSYHLVHIGVTE